MDKKITVYSTPTCPFCIKAKQYLTEKNINFENMDVSVNQEAAEEMVRKSGQMGVPVIIIDGEVIVGFDQNKIDQKLGL